VRTWWAAGEQHWLTDEEEAIQTVSNKDFEQADALAERVKDELQWRTDAERFPYVAAVGAQDMADLISVESTHPRLLGSITNGMKEALGPRRDMRREVGGVKVGKQRAWAVRVKMGEATRLHLTTPEGDPIDQKSEWAKENAVHTPGGAKVTPMPTRPRGPRKGA
jgi:hypothetical protein